MPQHSLCVFAGESVNKLRATLNDPEYAGDGTIVRVSREGEDFFLTVINAAGEGPGGINDSRPCPGSPGC